MNIILLRWLRWLVLAFVLCTLTVLLYGCIVPGGGYGYDDGGALEELTMNPLVSTTVAGT